jgi:hypothetical protein
MRAAVGACATLLAVGVTGAAQAAPQPSQSAPATTTYERGHVLECTAKLKQHGTAYVSLYANSEYGNHTQVVIGGDEPTYAGATQPTRLFDRGSIRTAVPVVRSDDDKPAGNALIKGRYAPVGKPKPYHEEMDDAGYHIVTTGTHQQIKARLSIEVLGQTARLQCGEAFAYDLKITKTPSEGTLK